MGFKVKFYSSPANVRLLKIIFAGPIKQLMMIMMRIMMVMVLVADVDCWISGCVEPAVVWP